MSKASDALGANLRPPAGLEIRFCALHDNFVEIFRCEPQYVLGPHDISDAMVEKEVSRVMVYWGRSAALRFAISRLTGWILVDPVACDKSGHALGPVDRYFTREQILQAAWSAPGDVYARVAGAGQS